jgi:hypothetical protein
MIQGRYNIIYKGFQLEIICIVKLKKDFKTIFGFTDYYINKHISYSEELRGIEAYVEYVDFYILSGEMAYVKEDLRGKLIKKTLVLQFLDEYRKIYKTYSDTIKKNARANK